jgi:CRP-like cAMP-binding protein
MERYMMVLKSIKRMTPGLEQVLLENFKPMPLKKGEVLQEPDTLTNYIYFIEKGLLHFYLPEKGGKLTYSFRREDQFALTLEAIFSPNSGYGIEALEDCSLWCLPGNLAEELCEKYHHFSLQYHEILVREALAVRAFLRSSHPDGGLANFDFFHSEFPELVHRVPIEYLISLTEIPRRKLKHLLESPIKLRPDTGGRPRAHK